MDFSLYIISYNFIIGILLMISSEKIGAFTGYFARSYKEKFSRWTRLGVFTFGVCVAVLSFGIYIAAYILQF
ncbi:MAG TPA: hypothetical protein PKE69_20385 [Pyrinomonadaceae bacterium]|nr:hypothetical protein [Pyrinomonadaceae bacterium]